MFSTAGNMEEKVICRICLKVLDPNKNSFGFIQDRIGTLKEMIMNCIPEMDIFVSPNPIVCFPCIQTLVSLHLFKNKCINTETIIRTYMKRNALPADSQVNLVNIVEDMIATGVGHDGTPTAQQGTGIAQPSNLIGEHLNTKVVLHPYPAKQYPCLSSLSSFNRSLNQKTYPSPAKPSTPQFRPVGQIRQTRPRQDFSHLRSMLNTGEQHRFPSHYHPYSPAPDMRSQFIDAYRPRVTESAVHNPLNNINGDPSTPPIESPVEPLLVNILELKSTGTPKNVDNKLEEAKDKEAKPKIKVHPIEEKMRLIVRIPRIHVPKETEDENKKSDGNSNERMSDDVTEVIAENPSEGQEIQDGNLTEPAVISGTFYDEPSRYLSCPHCPYVTNRSYALNKHINAIHTKSVWYPCESCSYSTTDKSSLRRHTRTVHMSKESNFQCKVCGEMFGSDYSLKQHLPKHNFCEMRCLFCPYVTKDRSNFRKHIFTHNPTSTQCDFCDYKCVSPYLMRSHLKRQHNGVGIEDIDCKSDTPLSKLLSDITAAVEEAANVK